MLLQHLVWILYCFTFCFDYAFSAPVHFKRQNGSNQAKTVTMVNVINTPDGPMTQTCTITLTPVDSAGTPAVQEVKTCNLQPALNGAPSATVPSTTGSSVFPAQSATSTPSSPPASVVSPSSSITSALPPPVASSSSPSPSPLQPTSATVTSSGAAVAPQTTPSSSTGRITVNGTSSIPMTAVPIPTSVPTSSIPNATPTAVPTPSTSLIVPSGSAKPTTSTASATAAHDASETPTQRFQIPGKNLSVLPIGLGVFAGILVIALIVVGLVTYERTKYRKAFRQRRLAEMGANIGYGGMSQV